MKKASLLATLCFVVLSSAGMADTVTLTSGEKLEGKITAENDSQITITVQVSAAITDERTINRSEIQKIEKSSEDDLAFAPLQGLKPDPFFSRAEDVNQNIAAINAFLQKYPLSSHAAEAKTILEAFQQEKTRLDAGDAKLFGTWIPKADVASRSVQFKGQALYLTMRTQAAQNDFIGALNTFADMESVNTTRAYPLSVELAKKIMPGLKAQVSRGVQNLAQETQDWNKGVLITPEPQKSQMIAARKAEQDHYEALMAAAAGNKQKWPPFLPKCQKDLEALKSLVDSEEKRVDALPVDKMEASLALTEKAQAALASKDTATAHSLVDQAKDLWSQNEEVVFVQTQLTQLADAESKKAAAQASAKPAGQAPKPAATPKPAGTPATTTVAAASPATADEDKPSFFFTIPGAMTIVGGAVALLIVASVLQKMKKPKAEEA